MSELNLAGTSLHGAMAGVMDEFHQGLLCRADPTCRVRFFVRSDELCDTAAAARNAHETSDHGYTHVSLEPAPFKFGASMSRKKHPL